MIQGARLEELRAVADATSVRGRDAARKAEAGLAELRDLGRRSEALQSLLGESAYIAYHNEVNGRKRHAP